MRFTLGPIPFRSRDQLFLMSLVTKRAIPTINSFVHGGGFGRAAVDTAQNEVTQLRIPFGISNWTRPKDGGGNDCGRPTSLETRKSTGVD
ncbi:predicted protein [Uncinocarpus reesii 1704]|uniref:Uncharacterized protein n=1 Tax=Uncinocarpus reesii (strain UAMH 1704) TaxID=336963 RepID=C4JQV1_UNCRE|nr:uncharacterized protein UREG_03433 [Uncinocarpus reesii 1704]EEP78587.1 predicted protein [Uncinocarpus reesii 1704]